MGKFSSATSVLIALGSNLGDREGLILTALQYLSERVGHIKKVSRLYETEPLLPLSSSGFEPFPNSEFNNYFKSRTNSLVRAESLANEINNPSDYLYLNAVTEVSTTLSPTELLSELQQIEVQLGRILPTDTTGDYEKDILTRDENPKLWAPRTIDLDILTYGNLCISTDKLVIPHPELHLRDFVLIPLQEITPEFRHPALDSSIGELLQKLHRHFVTGKSIPCRISSIKYQVTEGKIEAIDESKLASFA